MFVVARHVTHFAALSAVGYGIAGNHLPFPKEWFVVAVTSTAAVGRAAHTSVGEICTIKAHRKR